MRKIPGNLICDVALALGMMVCVVAGAQTHPPQEVDALFFESKVRPLLAKNCLGCHGVGEQMAHLDLRSREAVLKGGGRGAAVIPGHAEKSLLYQFVTGKRAPLMPPGGKLPATDVQILKQWLDGGAPWGGGAVATAKKQVWWSFLPPVRPLVPTLHSSAHSSDVEEGAASSAPTKGRASPEGRACPTPTAQCPPDTFAFHKMSCAKTPVCSYFSPR